MRTFFITGRMALYSLLFIVFFSCEKLKEDCFLEGNGQLNGEIFDFQTNWCVASFQKVYRLSGNDKQYIKDRFGLIFDPANLEGTGRFQFNLLANGNGAKTNNQTIYLIDDLNIKLIRQVAPTVDDPEIFREYDNLVEGELLITKFPRKKLVEGTLSFKVVASSNRKGQTALDTLTVKGLYFRGMYHELEFKEF